MNSIRLMAKNYSNHNYDARNEQACYLAWMIWDMMKNSPEISSRCMLDDNIETQLSIV